MAGAKRTIAPNGTRRRKKVGFRIIKTLATPDLPFAHGKRIRLDIT